MIVGIHYSNELPFILEIPDGFYDILVSKGIVRLRVDSNLFKLRFAKFAQFAGQIYITGNQKLLEEYIQTNNLVNYSFDICKTFVQYEIYKETDCIITDIKNITEEECVHYMEHERINNNFDVKKYIYAKKECDKIHDIDTYLEALNSLIIHCRQINRPPWIYRVDLNTLGSTFVQYIMDNKIIYRYHQGDRILSLNNSRPIFPPLTETEEKLLKDNLLNNSKISAEEELILNARTLFDRLEYRSAVLESNTALEIAINNKIKEKMLLKGNTQVEIDKCFNNLRNFEAKYKTMLKECNYKLNENNSILWEEIKTCRISYRNTIAHSDNIPDKATTERCISTFVQGIEFIHQLK